jgi:hypothetical protein
MVRTLVLGAALAAWSASAVAQVGTGIVTPGGQIFGNGTVYSQPMPGGGALQNNGILQSPNGTYSNGTTSQQNGNTTIFSNGRTCTTIGNVRSCN